MTRNDTPAGDLTVVRRAGRIVALQTSAALAAVLILVGVVVATSYARAQNNQINDELRSVAMSADDVSDPPPGMELVLQQPGGAVETSADGKAGVSLLSGPSGLTDVQDQNKTYRALVADRPEGRVVALIDLAPYRASRARLLSALALAELIGILASVAVVVLFTRRSVRPLAQALALQRRFVADASHELRAPLTVLHTRAQLLANRLQAGNFAGAARDAEALVADTRGLSGIVDDLLASATMTASTANTGVRIDMAVLGQSACASMQPYADSLGVSLRCTVGESHGSGSLDVIGSEAGLRRALIALIDNALGHESQGGTVEVDIQKKGRHVLVSVIDDGVGIDQATMATLFNRFSHGSAHTTRPERESYGIGLSLVREIVQAHGGEITVSSVSGQGATFSISLPAAV